MPAFGKICGNHYIFDFLFTANWSILNLVIQKIEYCSFLLHQFAYSVCNFQSMKSPVELNSLLSKFFCYITWLLYQLIRCDTGRLANEAFTSNPNVSSKRKLNGWKVTNCTQKALVFPYMTIAICKVLVWLNNLTRQR